MVACLFGISLLLRLANKKSGDRLSTTQGSAGSQSFPYRRREALLSAAEAGFFEALRVAAPDVLVFSKVRLEDIIDVERGLDGRAWVSNEPLPELGELPAVTESPR